MRRLHCQARECEQREMTTQSRPAAIDRRRRRRRQCVSLLRLASHFPRTVCCASRTSSSSVSPLSLAAAGGCNNKNRYSNKIKVCIPVVVFSLHEQTLQSRATGYTRLPPTTRQPPADARIASRSSFESATRCSCLFARSQDSAVCYCSRHHYPRSNPMR